MRNLNRFIQILVLSVVFSISVTAGEKKSSKEVQGFKVVSTTRGSVFEKLGLKKGDVIKSINGKPVATPNEATEVSKLLTTPGKVEVEVMRDGQIQKMTFEIE